VIDYVPWFQMSDPYVTREMTVRDLLVHRSGLGLGAGDLLWWPSSTYNRKEIARRLRYIPLVTSFRSAYAYDNVLYLVAGEVIEAVSGQSWEDFVASRILKKVGMATSNVRHSDATRVATSRRRTRRSTARCARSRPSTATTRTRPAASTPTRTTWRSGCWCSSAKASSPTARR
jgi:CubicO group peptidase (beta-lactamase class C family)